ncbi:MAG TPA: NfeD family protein [Methylomirabilota bacterium]
MVAAIVLLWLREAFGLPTWVAAVAFAVYVGKDLALYPAMRTLFRAPMPTRPIGQRAEAVERLAPSGYVRVNGELWKARVPHGDVRAGEVVVVRAADGFTLIVERPNGA